MVQITYVHMEGGNSHEHVAKVKWYNPSTGKTGESTRSEMVQFLSADKGNRAYVCDGWEIVDIQVVNANPPYIRTVKDGVVRDNLLNVPRY